MNHAPDVDWEFISFQTWWATIELNSCLSDVDDDRECEWDADDGEEDAEDAARRRHWRDVAVTCNRVGAAKRYISQRDLPLEEPN